MRDLCSSVEFPSKCSEIFSFVKGRVRKNGDLLRTSEKFMVKFIVKERQHRN